MSKTNAVADAWEDDWETAADVRALQMLWDCVILTSSKQLSTPPTEPVAEQKKVSSKVTKAQRRAQTLEFNRQLWAEAEGPRETNYFLETRLNATAPLRSEFKPPPILLSRKGPIKQSKKPPTDGIKNLSLQEASSSDEEEANKKTLTVEERKAQAAKEREEKQRKYEERRQELFGTAGTTNVAISAVPNSTTNASNGNSGSTSPRNTTPTPPGSRSATPNRSRGRGGKRGGAGLIKDQQKREKELFDPSYSVKPDSIYLQRREKGLPEGKESELQPIRSPRGPDASGRGGFGFAARGGKATTPPPAMGTA